MRQRGFTVIEVIIIIVVTCILSLIAVPKIVSLRNEAIKAAESVSVDAIRTGIRLYAIESASQQRNPLYPPGLDSAANNVASLQNPLFTVVLQSPITDKQWQKLGTSLYQAPTQSYYFYDSQEGYFLKCSGDKSLANLAQLYSYVPSQAVNSIDHSIWAVSNGGLYSPWSGYPLDFTLTFANAGSYKINLYALNNANHTAFTESLGQPARTDWHLPSGYTQFNVIAYMDGSIISPGGFSIAASDTETKSNSFTANLTGGSHTLRLVWTNDSWDPDNHGDSNIQFQNITIQQQ